MHVARGGSGRGRCAGWLVVGLVATAMGCTPWEHPAPAAHQAPATECSAARDQQPLPVITTLITRDHEVTVHASDDGLRFTVVLADGALLGQELDAHEFERSFPALHRRFDATFAGDELWLDASLQVAEPRPAPSHGPGAH
jgi:hypothetical protein